jgi:hypothetical protein
MWDVGRAMGVNTVSGIAVSPSLVQSDVTSSNTWLRQRRDNGGGDSGSDYGVLCCVLKCANVR